VEQIHGGKGDSCPLLNVGGWVGMKNHFASTSFKIACATDVNTFFWKL